MDGHPFGNLHYERYEGDLFVGRRVSGFDVGQGDLGDCFFLSSLVAFAYTDPAALRRAIVAHDDNTYTVTFQERRRGGVHPVRITVDTRFPTNARHEQAFGKGLRNGPHGQELWPALFEKAYATWQDGYIRVNEGGVGGAALTSLTGKPSKTLTPNRRSADELWQRIVRALDSRHPILASTPDEAELERRTGRSDLAGLLEDHFYTVRGHRVRRGRRFVRLYSPLVDFTELPVSTPSPADNALRTIEVRLENFRRDFDQLVVNANTP